MNYPHPVDPDVVFSIAVILTILGFYAFYLNVTVTSFREWFMRNQSNIAPICQYTPSFKDTLVMRLSIIRDNRTELMDWEIPKAIEELSGYQTKLVSSKLFKQFLKTLPCGAGAVKLKSFEILPRG